MEARVSTPPPRPPTLAVPPPPDTETSPPPACQVAPEPNTTVNLGAFLDAARDDGFPAQSDRPPPLEAPRATRRIGPLGVAIAAAVLAVGAAVAVASNRATTRRPPPAAALVAKASRSAAPAEPCTAGERRVLAHG